MKTNNTMNVKMPSILTIALSSTCLSLSPVLAQESDDEIEYEFTFAYEEGESANERDARLEDEIEAYCDGIDSSYYCEEEIANAVNEAMEEDEDDSERYASR